MNLQGSTVEEPMRYFSEREKGELPREQEEIRGGPWGGILALVQACITDGSFGATYPEECEDGGSTKGCDEKAFWRALWAEVTPPSPPAPAVCGG